MGGLMPANTTRHHPGRHPAPRRGRCPGTSVSSQGLLIPSAKGHPSSYLAVSPLSEDRTVHLEPLDTKCGFHSTILALRSFQ